ncbi:hypothetical protein FB451DRAFT_1178529 [Mycena latifolia]|nr:hypothetical protein FB451DRAFT_1178529 [Mycena latifolia]
MVHLFAHRDVHRSKRHATIVQQYLSGKSARNISDVLDAWLTSPDDAGYDQEDTMYQTAIPYNGIPHARARSCLTSFAAQIVKTKLLKEAKAAVKISGGMHAPTEHKTQSEDSTGKFADLATSLMHNMKSILKTNQGLFYDYTAISTVAMIDFCRNYNARLYPLVRGIIYLASHAPVDIITLDSHMGTMPSLGTIKSPLKGFSQQKAARIRSMGHDIAEVEVNGTRMAKANVVIFDNSQHFRRQRERRIGRENVMVIGISATFIQILVESTALDPLDKRVRLSLNLRRTLTVDQLITLIDFPLLRQVGILQKRQVPLEMSDINPLACSGKNEAFIPELKDALLDFQVWHTMWTDICRIHETHSGSPLNDNPASLGNSAKKIGRPAPANLKKCEDLHVYFATLAGLDKLPSFEELENGAKYLKKPHTTKTSWASQVPLGQEWVPFPIDATSASAPRTKRKRKSKKAASQGPPKEPVTPPIPPPFYGDQVISDNAGFMRDASISRAVSSAVAVGDVGRMWEGLKVVMINFAGSGHSRYFGYLLEMTADLKLESSPALRGATLDTTVCNRSGKHGGFQACDIFQEGMTRELEPIIQRKDTDYGSDHIRNMWSRNIKDIYDIKAEMRESVGLSKRSGRHKHPHAKPEVKILLRHYNDAELSERRPGRSYAVGEVADVDNFTAGLKKLGEGGLSKWVRRATMDRGLLADANEDEDSSNDEDDSDEEDEPNMNLGLIRAFDGEVVVEVEIDGEGADADEADAE